LGFFYFSEQRNPRNLNNSFHKNLRPFRRTEKRK
jgi:hypothetical protein